MLLPDSSCFDDYLLLEKIKSDDADAFNALFNKHWAKAFDQAYKRLKNEQDAKDVVQEIFIKIWSAREAMEIGDFEAYLYTGIRNNTLKLLLKQQPTHPFFNAISTLKETSALPESKILAQEFMQAYEQLLDTLPPQRRAIYYMRFQQQLSTKEIAARLHIKRKTVQNQLGKAVQTLKLSLLKLWLFIIVLVAIITN